jgi:hypothetical protein
MSSSSKDSELSRQKKNSGREGNCCALRAMLAFVHGACLDALGFTLPAIQLPPERAPAAAPARAAEVATGRSSAVEERVSVSVEAAEAERVAAERAAG